MALEAVQSVEPTSSPRISFSADFLDEKNFISISPNSQIQKEKPKTTERERARNNADQFEFLSSNFASQNTMLSADELFFEGKLLPFWQMHHSEKLNKISLKTERVNSEDEVKKEEARVNWFVDEDPSPRPPKCTVLWKELLRLKKQRASSLSPSASSSSSLSTSSSSSLVDLAPIDEGKEGSGNKENKHVKRIKKGLERTRSASIRIRPVINVPICTQGKSSAMMPPLFPLRKGR